MFVVAGLAFLGPRLDWRLAVVPVAILVVYAVNRFPVYQNRVSGPAWTSVVRRFDAACRQPGARASELRVAPQGIPVVRLECRYA